MEEIEQALPEHLKKDFLSHTVDPPQADIVRKAVAEIQSGSSVAVILPIELQHVLIFQGVAFELAKSEAQDRLNILVLAPTDLVIENYVQSSAWLKKLVSLERIDKHTLKSSTSLKLQLAESNILLSTPEQLLGRLRRNPAMFPELESFRLVVVDEYSDTAKFEKFREELKDLLEALVGRGRQFLYLAADSSISNDQKPWDTIPNLSVITARMRHQWRSSQPAAEPKLHRPNRLWQRTERERRPREAARWEHRQQERISIAGLERLFWFGLVVSLVVFNLQLLPLAAILARIAYLIREILPVVIRLVLIVAGIRLAIYIVFTWRPDFLNKLDIWFRKIIARILRIPEEALIESEPGYSSADGAEYDEDETDAVLSDDLNEVEQPIGISRVDLSPAFVPPPTFEDSVPVPIAARPARASLFNRTQAKAGPAMQAAPAARGRSSEESADILKELLDGFEVPVAHHAWSLPTTDLLDSYVADPITDELKSKSRLIEETLASFKVEAQVVGVNTGPTATQFELEPAVGVKVSKITRLKTDLMLALSAPSIRIEAPIPGKAVIGIEIPNSAISVVSMREMVDTEEFDSARAELKLPLGKDVSGTPVIAGLERMPHLLIAGNTGSGKSTMINSFVCALLLKYTPDELKFMMVDSKMPGLTVYNDIPHLLSPVVTELEGVVPMLKWATGEMGRRYKILAEHGFRNIDRYKTATHSHADLEPMSYIVIIIDELADLMTMVPDEVETLVCRLAQMARATGIHLIIATRRPSVDVVTGLIKANFPSRIAFAVTSQIDSRVILDMSGAEQLLGRGDMLYMAAEASKSIRVQGTYVSNAEVERIVSFWRGAHSPDMGGREQELGIAGASATSKASSPTANLHPATLGTGEFLSIEEQDELLPEAIKLVKQHQRASASLLQRRLRIGYSKAAQLIDLLEQQGIVGPAEDGRSREVFQGNGD